MGTACWLGPLRKGANTVAPPAVPEGIAIDRVV